MLRFSTTIFPPFPPYPVTCRLLYEFEYTIFALPVHKMLPKNIIHLRYIEMHAIYKMLQLEPLICRPAVYLHHRHVIWSLYNNSNMAIIIIIMIIYNMVFF